MNVHYFLIARVENHHRRGGRLLKQPSHPLCQEVMTHRHPLCISIKVTNSTPMFVPNENWVLFVSNENWVRFVCIHVIHSQNLETTTKKKENITKHWRLQTRKMQKGGKGDLFYFWILISHIMHSWYCYLLPYMYQIYPYVLLSYMHYNNFTATLLF